MSNTADSSETSRQARERTRNHLLAKINEYADEHDTERVLALAKAYALIGGNVTAID